MCSCESEGAAGSDPSMQPSAWRSPPVPWTAPAIRAAAPASLGTNWGVVEIYYFLAARAYARKCQDDPYSGFWF